MINIVHKLRIARGTNKKLAILKEYKDDEDWLEFLKAVYTTSVNYYISAPNDSTFTSADISMAEVNEHLEWLTSRLVTGNDARAHALEGSRLYGEMYRLILSGSIKAGVSVTSVNKAYPGLIPTFNVMLAKDVPITQYPCIASTKYDGVRLLVFVSVLVKVRLVLRSGKQIHIKSLEYEMSQQPPGVYDGELVAGDGLQEGRTKITGSVNRCLKGSDTDIKDYSYCIFDMLEHAEWTEQATSRPYVERVDAMNKGIKQNSKVKMADMFVMDSISQVDQFYHSRLSRGYEGIIVRYSFDSYVWGRSAKLIKKKATEECELECTDTTEGTGKYEGLIGALVCQGVVDGKEVRVKLGSGLTDHDREQDPTHFIGCKIDVLYNDVVMAENADHHSLFLPRYKRIVGDNNI